jgi:hypothetical protein
MGLVCPNFGGWQTEVAEEAGLNPDHVLAALGFEK